MKIIYENLKFKDDNINTYYIVEPFCGSSAMSYYIWLNNKDKTNFKYILNDNDKFIIDLYNIAKDENKLKKFREEIELIYKNIFVDIDDKDKQKEEYNKLKTSDTLLNYIFLNKVFNIRPGLYPQNRKFNFKAITDAPIIEFLRTANIEISNKDGLEVYEKYINNPNAFIFIDPPYMSSENSFYKCPSITIYEYLCENDITKNKAYITLCLENNWIIKLLFRGKKMIEYDKKYKNKKTKHVFITN